MMTPLELVSPVGYVMCAFWFFYFACACVVHHRRIRMRASRMLIIFGFCEIGFCIFKATAHIFSNPFITIQVIALDFLLAGIFTFDVLYKDFFHDEGPYNLFFGKKIIPAIIGWATSHVVFILHDSMMLLELWYSLIGFYGIGPVILAYLLAKL
nr:hypothetical protein [Candidatus Sigynarchaeota archaeon]